MQDKSYRTSTALANAQHGAAPGWARYTDERGITQYAPVEPRHGAEIAPRGQFQPAPFVLDVPPARQTVIHDRSTEVERSTAFVRFTIPLSTALAAVTLIAAIVGGVAALAAVGLSFFVFAGCWLGALIYYVSRSPAGTARHDSNQTWKLLRNEQKHRHEIEWYLLEKHYHDNDAQ